MHGRLAVVASDLERSGRHACSPAHRAYCRSERVPAVARLVVGCPVLEVGVGQLIVRSTRVVEHYGVGVRILGVGLVVVTAHYDGEGVALQRSLHSSTTAIGHGGYGIRCGNITPQHVAVGVLVETGQSLTANGERLQARVVDEAHLVNRQCVVSRTAGDGVRGERGQQVLTALASRVAGVVHRGTEVGPLRRGRYEDGTRGYLVSRVLSQFRVAVFVLVVQDELAATILAAARDELGVAGNRVGHTDERQVVSGVIEVAEVVVLGGIGSHAAHVDGTRRQVAVGVGYAKDTDRTQLHGRLAVVASDLERSGRHACSPAHRAYCRSERVPAVARLVVGRPVLEVGVGQLIIGRNGGVVDDGVGMGVLLIDCIIATTHHNGDGVALDGRLHGGGTAIGHGGYGIRCGNITLQRVAVDVLVETGQGIPANGDRLQTRVVDEAHLVNRQCVVSRTSRHGVGGERGQQVLATFASRVAGVGHRGTEVSPVGCRRDKDGALPYLVGGILSQLRVAVLVLVVQDELAPSVLATARNELGVAGNRVGHPGKGQVVSGVVEVTEVVVLGGIGSHAAHVDGTRRQVAVGVGYAKDTDRTQLHGRLAVVASDLERSGRHACSPAHRAYCRSERVPAVARLVVGCPVLEVRVGDLIIHSVLCLLRRHCPGKEQGRQAKSRHFLHTIKLISDYIETFYSVTAYYSGCKVTAVL